MQDIYSAISRSLSGRMLGHALALLRPWVAELGVATYSDRLQSILRNYQYTADYFLSGKDDPSRQEVVDMLVRDAYLLLDEVWLQKRLKESSSMEFVELQRPLSGYGNPQDAFRFFWLGRLEDWDREALLSLVANPEMEDEAMMGVSGLTLNLLRSFSLPNILCLMKAAEETVPQCIRERAWVGLMLVLLQYDDRLLFFPEMTGAFQDLISTEDGSVYARTVLTCLIRTMGVEWASASYKNLQNQILSQLQKMGPNFNNPDAKLTADDIDDFSARFQDECAELIDQQRLDMSKLQEQHLDTHFAMFRSLYSTPFFSEIYRWWLPYVPDYLPEDLKKSSAILRHLPLGDLCDSDKYAFLSGLSNVGFVNGQSVDEMLKADMPEVEQPEDTLLCNAYVKQAYRFFVLNPWHIANPFSLLKNIAMTNLIRILNPTAQEKHITASHCLACHAYDSALGLYRLAADTVNTAQVYREKGFVCQKLLLFGEAVDSYGKALAIESTEWTLRQLEYCYCQLHQFTEALEITNRLLAINPQNSAYIFEKAKCLERLELWAEALPLYFRLELTSPDNPKVLRAIAWCNYVCENYEASETYYLKLQKLNAMQATDYLNTGHLFFVLGRRMEALQAYQRCMMQQPDLKSFLQLFRPDRNSLLEKGVSRSDIYFMEDQLILLRQQG